MWRIILSFTIVIMNYGISERLIGDHICEVHETYVENVTEYYLDNITIRNYKWCMSVPPRCSDYTMKKVNKSRIVGRESTRLVEKCCPGFEENQDNTFCVPTCPTCSNGTCKLGKCTCLPGFKGDTCDTSCEATEWGPNCKYECACDRGMCHPTTGSCICPSGWMGNQCQHLCTSGFYGDGCLQECQCGSNEPCHHVNGGCTPETTSSSTSPTTTSTGTTAVVSSSSLPISTRTEEINGKDEASTPKVVVFTNNGKLSNEIKLEKNSSSGEIDSMKNRHEDIIKLPTISRSYGRHHGYQMKDSVNTEEGSYIDKTLERPLNEITKSTKAKVNNERDDFINGSTSSTISSTKNDNDTINKLQGVLMNSQETLYIYNPYHKHITSFPNYYYALIGVAIAIIVIGMPITAAVRIIRRRKQLEAQNEEKKIEGSVGNSAMPVFTHNIFDTPLPDLPCVENILLKSEILDDESTFRMNTPVVRNTSFQVQPDPREYLYDHPPSTGSYRAVSVPEPPDKDDISSVQSDVPHSEPVYDEIPSGQLPQRISAGRSISPPLSSHHIPSSLYMNTYAKTRL